MHGLAAQNGIIQRDFLGACIASQNVELFRGFVVNIWMDRVVVLRMEFATAIASLTSLALGTGIEDLDSKVKIDIWAVKFRQD